MVPLEGKCGVEVVKSLGGEMSPVGGVGHRAVARRGAGGTENGKILSTFLLTTSLSYKNNC